MKEPKKKSLRTILRLPIGVPITSISGIETGEGGDGGGMSEMVEVYKIFEKSLGEQKLKQAIYDIEEADDDKKFSIYVVNPETNEMKKVKFGDPKMVLDPKNRAFKPIVQRNPRYWLSKFWSNNDLKEMISEIVRPEEVDVSSIKQADELCPLLWNNDELDGEVRLHLIKIAAEFIKSCKLDDYKFEDVVLMGSMANFNYTPTSDIDLHIIMDFKQFKIDPEIIGEYFSAKKDIWSTTHKVQIKGHDVECYIQDVNEKNASLGIYSLMKNEWIRKPLKEFVSIDEPNVQVKAAAIINKIDEIEGKFKKGHDVTFEAKKLKDKIKKMRQAGLYKEGEYSTENIVFKVLRNSGYLEKLINLKNNSIDQTLSLS